MKNIFESKFKIVKNKIIKSKLSFEFLSILIIAIILLTGCTQVGYSAKNYRTGTQGLVIEFGKNIKSVVYEREEFGNLLAMEKTQSRIEHTLKTGKPLRN